MIELLPRWNLHSNRPTFYDTDTVTMLELASRLHGAMNELITDYNNMVSELNEHLTDFESGVQEDFQTHETALRQEFQDFIDVIDLKIVAIEQDIADFKTNASSIISQAQELVTQAENKILELELGYEAFKTEIREEMAAFRGEVGMEINAIAAIIGGEA